MRLSISSSLIFFISKAFSFISSISLSIISIFSNFFSSSNLTLCFSILVFSSSNFSLETCKAFSFSSYCSKDCSVLGQFLLASIRSINSLFIASICISTIALVFTSSSTFSKLFFFSSKGPMVFSIFLILSHISSKSFSLFSVSSIRERRFSLA